MTHDEDTIALFERVLDALTRAAGDQAKLTALLASFPEDIRAMAVIRGLLTADTSLRQTFTAGEIAQRDSALAGRAALALAQIADRIEAKMPSTRDPVRLSEMALDRDIG
ncbi:hypothetical protein [Roseicyclus sp.]|uniref:hypothetical protein n=1 Tax=Roseicyclus sp. TaxID=1914329 RepID=UPI001BD1A728|nr:hypothetical protein [Roseicyclus sp.]